MNLPTVPQFLKVLAAAFLTGAATYGEAHFVGDAPFGSTHALSAFAVGVVGAGVVAVVHLYTDRPGPSSSPATSTISASSPATAGSEHATPAETPDAKKG